MTDYNSLKNSQDFVLFPVKKEIELENLDFKDKILGKGAFGQVFYKFKKIKKYY